MAESPSHKFGQIIGDVLENASYPLLKEFSKKHGIYLDKQGPRPARKGKKVTWTDMYGNKHDLDFVFERNGSAKKIGTPIAFIESAWRRYTKHSRNKVQEIQGAVLPLALTHKNTAPFLGAILGGVFTKGALTQLSSLGFSVLYFTYEDIIKAFKTVGIDASFDEQTPDSKFAEKVKKWNELTSKKQESLTKYLVKIKSREVNVFIKRLEESVVRRISSVIVIPLHGKSFQLASINKAIDFIKKYDEKNGSDSIVRYEVQIKYNNKDEIKGEFEDKKDALNFLQSYS